MRSEKLKKNLPRFVFSLLAAHFLTLSPGQAATPPDLEEQTRTIAAELRCPVCQNLSVADSPSEMAQQMRALISEQLNQGRTPEEIKAYFVSKYGDWVLLAPPRRGFSLLVWLLPFLAVTAGIVMVLLAAKRWVKRKGTLQPAPVDPLLMDRIRRETAAAEPSEQDVASGSALENERTKLYGYLKDLEFDYQAGRISSEDYQDLRRQYESRAALVLKEIDASPPSTGPRTGPSQAEQTGAQETSAAAEPHQAPRVAPASPRPGWRFVAGGIFLVLFGITVGFLLNQSLRPRASEQDTITGGFLTGTGKDLSSYLEQGRAAFDREDWPQAIDAFKEALAVDPNHPEAHAYMGLILVQAGHADGAFLAFERALSSDPNFPLALWGKGMLLYQAKQDYAGAREALEKLVRLSPPGEERNQIQKTIDELASREKKSPVKKADGSVAGTVQGVVSVAPELKPKVEADAVLFIMARAAGSTAGPPLAVKRIERPAFPVAFSLGAKDVMMPGAQLGGRVTLSARLDRDGNPATHEPGDLTGDYKNNPVEVGAQKVDIVIDRVL